MSACASVSYVTQAAPRWSSQNACAAALANVWPAPLQVVFSSRSDQSASTYPAYGLLPRPRWRSARPGPHKSYGVQTGAIVQNGIPARRSTVRPSQFSPPANCKLHSVGPAKAQARLRLCSGRPSVGAEVLSAPQHRPGNGCKLVGQRHNHGILMGPRQQRAQPCPQGRCACGEGGKRSAGAVDQQLS